MTTMTDREIFNALSQTQRNNLAYRMWQQDSQITTHGPGCHSWGPAHYQCALNEIKRLAAAIGEQMK